jgi:hypothetical protein
MMPTFGRRKFKMDKVLKELEEFRKELDKIKQFCILVAVEHKHIPGLNRAWHDDSEDAIYTNSSSATIMKTLMHLIFRIENLEDANVRQEK